MPTYRSYLGKKVYDLLMTLSSWAPYVTIPLVVLAGIKYGKELKVIYATLVDKTVGAETCDDSPADNYKSATDAEPLTKHMETFADAAGWITKESIYKACRKKWHLDHEKANTLALGTFQVALLRGVDGVYFNILEGITGRFKAKDAINKLTHPSDTGLFHKSGGTLDYSRFDDLERYAITDNSGKKLITHDCLKNYLASWYQNDKRWEHESFFYRIIGKLGNEGEYEIMFKKASRHELLDPVTNIKKPAICLDDLRHFLENSASLVREIELGGGLQREFTQTTTSTSLAHTFFKSPALISAGAPEEVSSSAKFLH